MRVRSGDHHQHLMTVSGPPQALHHMATNRGKIAWGELHFTVSTIRCSECSECSVATPSLAISLYSSLLHSISGITTKYILTALYSSSSGLWHPLNHMSPIESSGRNLYIDKCRMSQHQARFQVLTSLGYHVSWSKLNVHQHLTLS